MSNVSEGCEYYLREKQVMYSKRCSCSAFVRARSARTKGLRSKEGLLEQGLSSQFEHSLSVTIRSVCESVKQPLLLKACLIHCAPRLLLLTLSSFLSPSVLVLVSACVTRLPRLMRLQVADDRR